MGTGQSRKMTWAELYIAACLQCWCGRVSGSGQLYKQTFSNT